MHWFLIKLAHEKGEPLFIYCGNPIGKYVPIKSGICRGERGKNCTLTLLTVKLIHYHEKETRT